MRVEYEIIYPDEGSSFRVLNQTLIPEEHVWEYHYHPELELVCVLKGSGTRHVGNHFANYDDGDLVLIGSELPHSGFGLNSPTVHEEVVLQIKKELIYDRWLFGPETETINTLIDKAKHGICFTGNIKKAITKHMKTLKHLCPFDRYIKVMQIFKMLAGSNEYFLLNKNAELPATQLKSHARLKKIFRYVEGNFNKEINIAKAASQIGLSVPSFCNYFKKTMGITFTDFINNFRIQHACMLIQQEKTIAEVCYECGYNNITYFNRVFKTIIKKTPSQFKTDILSIRKN